MNEQDKTQVAEFMRALAEATDDEPRLPDPRLIARRARLLQTLAEEDAAAERATRPILVAGLAGPFLAAAVFSALLAPRSSPLTAAIVILASLALATALPLVLSGE